MDEPDQYIDFLIKYKDWIAIKRIGIRENTTPQEVAFHLAGIRGSMDKKVYGILGIKTEPMDAFAESAVKDQKRNYDSLSAAIATLGKQEARKAVDDACSGNKDLKPLAETYLLDKIITSMGYDTFLNQTAMSKIWKELKLPKQRGRKAGAKKEKEISE